MNVQRLARQLRREATANPKKAVILGVLVLLAAYYWIPMATGRFGDRSPTPPTASPRATGPTPAVELGGGGGTAKETGSGPESPTWRWDELASWREADPRTSPVPEWPAGRDPFRRAGEDAVTEDEPPPPVAAAITPPSLGLTLSGTIVSPERRAAVIGGRVYAEGSRLELVNRDGPIVFVLSEVGPRHVVLEREGTHFELVLPERAITGRFELSRMEP